MSDEPLLVRAPNPGPFTLSGTNTWIVGRDPCYVVDPGPAIEEHLQRVARLCRERGGAAMLLLTHDHHDHAEGIPGLRSLLGEIPVVAARGPASTLVADGQRIGPFAVHATPGHAPDHLAYVYADRCFTGDAVLGQGSVFVAPDPGAMAGYLRALRGLRALPLRALHPGHGPLIEEPQAKLDAYIAHRLARERDLLDALAAGLRGAEELLDRVWSDAPAELRIAAAVTLEAHLGKLAEEGRLPAGVERRDFSWLRGTAV
ncbi:MAG: MBL fold metallo-hydrolase [Solirubrobacteraceae bacterium]